MLLSRDLAGYSKIQHTNKPSPRYGLMPARGPSSSDRARKMINMLIEKDNKDNTVRY